MQAPFADDHRVLQIHPTVGCNLEYPHNFSSLKVGHEAELPLHLLQQTLTDAAAEGYNTVTVSGAEPLMSRSLYGVFGHARSLGMGATITTNGLPLTPDRLRELRSLVDLMAIKLDGVDESLNRIHGNPEAFRLLKRRLENVRNSGVKFGFVFTLTMHNLHELADVARFAVEQGASLLEVHPLEQAGRARRRLAKSSPDDLELAYAFLECARIKKMYVGKLQVQFDVADRELLRDSGRQDQNDEQADSATLSKRPLADLVPTLIVESDGFVVPIQCGFSRAYGLGNIKDDSLLRHAARWKKNSYPAFRHLCHRVFHQLVDIDRSDLPFTNWYGMIMQSSYGHALSR